MPLPKRRHSKARGRRRRTHWTLTGVSLTPCPQCKQQKAPHRVCPVCGFYGGRQAMEVTVREKKPKR